MAMKATDRLMAAPRGSAQEALAFFRSMGADRMDEVTKYVNTVFDLAPKAGLDPAVVIAQASHETGYFTSYWWNARLNPAGLGITGDPKQNNASKWFKDGAEAARAQMAHLMLYATGRITSPFSSDDDPRYDAYVKAYGTAAKAPTIAGLTNTWGIDSGYATKMVNHGNRVFKNLPESKPADSKPPTDPPPTTPADGPVVYVQTPWDGSKDVTFGGLTYRGKRGTVTVDVDALNVRDGHTTTNTKVLRTVRNGTKLNVLGWVKGQNVDGVDAWWITDTYERVWAGGTKEKP